MRSLDANAGRFGLERKRLMARQGDVLIWHADLVHGGDPVSRQITRRSIVTHYCPKHHAPLFCEGRNLGFHDYEGHAFTSSLYPGLPLAGDAPAAASSPAEAPAIPAAERPVPEAERPAPLAAVLAAPAAAPLVATPQAAPLAEHPAPAIPIMNPSPAETMDPMIRQLRDLIGLP